MVPASDRAGAGVVLACFDGGEVRDFLTGGFVAFFD